MESNAKAGLSKGKSQGKPPLPQSPPPSKYAELLKRAREKADARENAEFWDPKPGDSIAGEVVDITHHNGSYDNAYYFLKLEDGTSKIVSAGSSTILFRKLRDKQLEIGDDLAVVYLGEDTSADGRRYKKWACESQKRARPADGPPLDDDIPFPS